MLYHLSNSIQGDTFYIGSDNNTIEARKIADGNFDGIVTKFTAPVTHIDSNKSGTHLVAGAW